MHHTRSLRRLALSGASVVVLAASLAAQPQQVRIRVTNLAPVNGTALTPVWLGIHDGSFNLFTPGMAASTALERIAEDGNVMPLATAFGAAGFGTQGVAGSGPLLAGQTAEFTFMLDRANPLHRFLSYASMLLPSNDAFIGTMNPRGRALTDANGNFQSFSFTVGGNQVWDAGTEVNDEAENSTAFFGQTMPNTGVTENGTVQLHPGFQRGGRILSAPQFRNADFTQPGYSIARFEIEVVPEPSTAVLLFTGLAGLGLLARRRATRA